MKEFYLDLHTYSCDAQSKKETTDEWFSSLKDWCKHNPERFLFYVGNKFVIITYHTCMDNYDQYSFKKKLVEQVIGDNKIFEKYEVNRGVCVDEELRDFRIRNKNLRKSIQIVNYLYHDATYKEYAITTTTDFIENLVNSDLLEKAYKEAKDFLIRNEYTWLIEPLNKLYYANITTRVSDIECVKTIDAMVKKINNQINK